ncbi:MAG TPA: bi-domain-containing oxidoreductase [Candidatus Nanoarchaeia archaeon]|nr:bi-domain-containing oxidoreductase [Candidatus Nanoarchaeia archaeon]
MKQLCRDTKGNIVIEEVPAPSVEKGKVIVKTLYSLISTGTEIRTLNSTKQNYYKTLKSPKSLLRVAKKIAAGNLKSMVTNIKGKLEELVPLGYSCVGTVMEKGSDVQEFSVGDIVACMGPDYAMHAEIIAVPLNLAVKVQASVDKKQAAFVTLGCIAMHAMRNAKVQLGDTVAVVGLGLIGQVLVRLLKLQGAHVIGLDVIPERVVGAKKYGAEKTILIKENQGFAKEIARATENRGCDAVIVCTSGGSQELFEELAMSCRDRARFVLVGSFDVNLPYTVFYRKELEFVISRSTGPGRYDEAFEAKNMQYPRGFVPWTEKRNAEEFLELIATKKLNVADLIAEEYPLDKAKQAYQQLQAKQGYGVLLTYEQENKVTPKRKIELSPAKIEKDILNVAVAGLGMFAKNVQLPNIAQQKGINLRAVYSSSPMQAKNIAKQFKAEYCATDYQELLKDPTIDLIIITSKNNMHAAMAIQAANAKKNVFLEKPMALNEKELKDMIYAINKNNIFFTLGLNRRFSPILQKVKETIRNRSTPLMITYRFNDENKAERAWVDTQEGGGRILHLANHMIDVCAWLVGAEPVTVTAQNLNAKERNMDDSNVAMMTNFEDGSLATMVYTSLGNAFMPRERIEIYVEGKIIVIENFQHAAFYGMNESEIKLPEADKGYSNQLKEIRRKMRGEEAECITLWDAVRSTVFCFRVMDSLKEKKPVRVNHMDYLQ